jgi:hypothetical protein
MTTVWIYEKPGTLRVFDSKEDAHDWLKQNDPDGEVIEHHVSALRPAGSADQCRVPRATERLGPRPRLVK